MLNPADLQLHTLRLYGELLARHDTLASRLVLACGPACSASGLPAAVSIAGGTSLLLDPDAAAVKSTFRAGGLDFLVTTLDEALRILKNEIRKHTPVSVALTADPAAVLAEMRDRGLLPDLQLHLPTPAQPEPLWLHPPGSRSTLSVALEPGSPLPPPTPQLTAWLAARHWSEHLLPAPSTADLRSLDVRLLQSLNPADAHRLHWLRRIAHYQRPAPNSSRAIWLSPQEHAHLLTPAV